MADLLTVHAVVVNADGSSLDDASSGACAPGHPASCNVPRSVSWVDEFPKSGSPIVLSRELRRSYRADRGSNV